MYRAEEFLRGVPMFQDRFIKRLEREGCLPFDAEKIEKISVSSSERAILNLALLFFNTDNKFNLGHLMRNLSHQPTLDYVASWIAKGPLALD